MSYSANGLNGASDIAKSSSVNSNGNKDNVKNKNSNEDLFLKLLVAQMKNQDPFNTQDPTQYVTQLAQFNMLEQITSLNDNMEYLLAINNGLLVNSAMEGATNLIGKEVNSYVDESREKTITGIVDSVNIKNGVVYLDIIDSKNNDVVSVEYSYIKSAR